jgi:hypothetical protein
MKRVLGEYHIKVASDINRDGLVIELWDDCENIVVEVFRSDKSKTITLRTFDREVPLQAIEALIKFSRQRLEPFEDGTHLPRETIVRLSKL